MIALGHLRGLGAGGSLVPAAALDLDFLSGQIDPRLTYARASLASRIDGAGRLSISPHNLCVHSEQFELSWMRENISAFGSGSSANAATAPDGSSAADLIDDGASSGRHIIYQAQSVPGDGTYAGSIFVKDFGRRFVQLLVTSQGYTCGGFIIVDLQTGALTQTKAFASGAPVVSSAIEGVGGGWFRISLCFKVLSGVSFLFFIVAASDRPSDASGAMLHGSPSYAGVGMKLAVWGGQLELIGDETSVRPYVRANAVPFYGPRLDHAPATGAPRGLLVEEARTNLILRSQKPLSQSIPVVAQPHTLSFYGAGTITLSGAVVASVPGLGAYPARRVFTFTPNAGMLALSISGEVHFVQCELGGFATSWIPTWSVPGARAADDVRLNQASLASWLNAAAGLFLVEASRFSVVQRGDVLNLRNSANAALADVSITGGASGALDVSMRTTAGVFAPTFPSAFASGGAVRTAVAYGVGEGGVSVNGAAVVSSAGVLSLLQADAMTIGSNAGAARHYLNGHVRRIRHYPGRLSNSVLRKISV